MSMRRGFHKALGDFDQIELDSEPGSDWLRLTMHVGKHVDDVVMVFRGDEAVRDLHYALGRYLAHIEDGKAA